MRPGLGLGLGLGLAGLLATPIARDLRLRQPTQPLTEDWRNAPIEPRGSARLGISFRSPQVEAFGLDGTAALRSLLDYPFHLLRLGAYWRRIEPRPGVFDPRELDSQIEAAERAAKQIIVCVGALKTFGYPEFFAPDHHLRQALPEGTRIRASAYASLLAAATEFVERVVERYKGSPAVVGWQVEHEAVDPLGMEHSWRLDAGFVEREVQAVRQADPSRPIIMNGFLPASLLVTLAQWWQTRDQGDSLVVASRLADIVGVDVYPRHALFRVGGRTLYVDGSHGPWQQLRLRRVFAAARRRGRRVMISEGQAEPWEAVTLPPNPDRLRMYSCPPEQVIATYNRCLAWARSSEFSLDAYLFWGAEYWMLRHQAGDSGYLDAFARILEASA
jgi:glycosyl hydrolase family 42 (putative beta-galactosidase)